MAELKEREKEQTEAQRVAGWRQETFVKILKESGVKDDDLDLVAVQMLVDSDVYPWDLHDLIQKGCAPDLAIRILA